LILLLFELPDKEGVGMPGMFASLGDGEEMFSDTLTIVIYW